MTDEQKKLVEDNMGLVHCIVYKFTVKGSAYEIEELVSIGYYGLCKAANTYKASKGAKFSTYAGVCIENELKIFFRNNNKRVNDMSIYSEFYTGRDENLEIIDTIEDPYDIERECLALEEYRELLDEINSLKSVERNVMLMTCSGKSQVEISGTLKISQSYVSRVLRNVQKSMREKYF